MKPTRIILPDAAQIALEQWHDDVAQANAGNPNWFLADDPERIERATRAVVAWSVDVGGDLGVAALWVPKTTPADLLGDVMDLVSDLAYIEEEQAEQDDKAHEGECAKWAREAARGLSALHRRLDKMRRGTVRAELRARSAARGEVELDRRRSPKTVMLDGQEREVLAASLCACGGVRVTTSYTPPCKQLVCARTGCRVGVIYEGRTVAPRACDEAPSVVDAEALAGVKVRRVTP